MTSRRSIADIRAGLAARMPAIVLAGALSMVAPVTMATSVVAQAQRPGIQQQQPAPRQMPQQRSAPQVQPEPGSPQSSPAQAQKNRAAGPTQHAASAEFRTALAPHGRWQQSSRFGEIWVPANRGRDWRPYTVGRWVYSEDWGWYWAEDPSEADWGWATYHYGRWIDDADLGWAWIPGDEWGPGFVQWRHGGDYVGWAPLPADDLVVEYRDQPDVWVFTRTRDFVAAPRLAAVILPVRDYPTFVRDTIVVNQTVILGEGRNFAVNPGIPAAVIAADIGRPVRAFDVRPRVLAGTASIPGAIELRAQDLRSGRFRAEPVVRETRNEIRPTQRAPQLQPLAAGERGRLGDNPPRAAQRAVQQQQGQPPPQQGQAQQRQQGRGKQEPQTQGRAADEQRRREQQGQQAPQQQGQQPTEQRQQQGRSKQEPQTQGRAADEQRRREQQGQQAPQRQGQQPTQQRQQQGRGKQEPQTQGRAADEQRRQEQQSRQPAPQRQQGRSSDQQRRRDVEREGARREQQRQGTEGRGAQQRQSQPDRSGMREQRREQGATGTVGRGGGAAERPQRMERSQPQQRGGPGATEGRGGGGARERGPAGGGGRRGGEGPGAR